MKMKEKFEVFAVTSVWELMLQMLEASSEEDLDSVETKGGSYYYNVKAPLTPEGKFRVVRFLSPEQAKEVDGGMAKKIASQAAEMEDKFSVPIPDIAKFEENLKPCKERQKKICAIIGAESASILETCNKTSNMVAAISRNLANFPTATS